MELAAAVVGGFPSVPAVWYHARMTSYTLVMPGDLNHYGRRHIESREETSVFTTDITFVRVGRDGEKMPISSSIPSP